VKLFSVFSSRYWSLIKLYTKRAGLRLSLSFVEKKVTYVDYALHYICTEFTVHSVSSDRVVFARRHSNSLKIFKTSNYKQMS